VSSAQGIPCGPPARPDRVACRYGRLLRAYPPVWRAAHGQALLGTLLEVAEHRGGGPTRAEAVDLIGHGLVIRLRLLAPARQSREWAAAAAMVAGTVLALTWFLAGEWLPWPGAPAGWRATTGHLGPFATAGPLLYLLWPAAVAAVAFGRGRLGRRLVAATVPVGVAIVLLAPALGVRRPPLVDLVVLGSLTPAAMLAAQPRSARRSAVLALATLAGTAALVWHLRRLEADLPAWAMTDPSFTFYRGPFTLALSSYWVEVKALMLVAAASALATIRGPRGLCPGLMIGTAGCCLPILAALTPTAGPLLLLLAAPTLAALAAWAFGLRWRDRSTRPLTGAR
jgi:hypothetical protein